MDEFAFIAGLLRPLATGPEALGLADDAALLTCPPGQSLVVSADMLQAGVHFFAEDAPSHIAQKALRVNLSDLAAMGAEPYCYFLSLGLPEGTDEAWLRGFCDGLAADQAAFGMRLAGGDTTRTQGPLSLSITAVGQVPAGQALHRGGGRAGDLLYVSGTLGEAALGLALRRQTAPGLAEAYRQSALQRYLLPEPRLALGQALRGIARAAMDLSDGLMQDLSHLAKASGCGASVDADALPWSPALQAAFAGGVMRWQQAVAGGDDYELLFAVPPDRSDRLKAVAAQTGLPLQCIGRLEAGSEVRLLDAHGHTLPLVQTGYRHRFQRD